MIPIKASVKSFLHAIFPDHEKGKEVFYQGSRQMTSTSRRYYEKELGAGIGPGPGLDEMFGYTEPLRRLVQREDFTPQANEIANTMPSWMPGDDYYTNFRVGDPYVKVDQGFARLPGEGYAALHPELEGVTRSLRPAAHNILPRGCAMAPAQAVSLCSILGALGSGWTALDRIASLCQFHRNGRQSDGNENDSRSRNTPGFPTES